MASEHPSVTSISETSSPGAAAPVTWSSCPMPSTPPHSPPPRSAARSVRSPTACSSTPGRPRPHPHLGRAPGRRGQGRRRRRRARARRAAPDFVRRHTGQVIGGVSPFDHPAPVGTWIDTDLRRYDVVWAAAGHPAAVFSTTFDELVALTGATEIEVDVNQGWIPLPRLHRRLGQRHQRLPGRAGAGDHRPGRRRGRDPRRAGPLGRAGGGRLHVRHRVRRRQDPLDRLHLGRDLHRHQAHRGRRHRRPAGRGRHLARDGRRSASSAAAPRSSHLVKAGGRLAVNGSPEPVSNTVASVTEDVTVLGVVWLAVEHPQLAAAIAALLLAGGLVMLCSSPASSGGAGGGGRAASRRPALGRGPPPRPRVPAMARVVVVGGGSAASPRPPGWPSWATRSPWSSGSRPRAARCPPSSSDGFAWDAGPDHAPCSRRWSATCSASPAARWSASVDLVPLDVVREHRFEDGSVAAAARRLASRAARRLRRARRGARRAVGRLRRVVRRRLGPAAPRLPRATVGPRRSRHGSSPTLLTSREMLHKRLKQPLPRRAAAPGRRPPASSPTATTCATCPPGRAWRLRRAELRRLDGPRRDGRARRRRSPPGWRPAGSPC